MKPDEVPQDHLSYYAQGRKAIYATDGAGQILPVPSSGWVVEETVTAAAADEYRRLAEDALARARRGEASALEVHMYVQRMDPPQLAQSVRMWRWRVRRHLRPQVFARLSVALLARYAEALGVPVDRLRRLPDALE